ncbi:MAG: FAD-dependent oxidoreductase [Acidobacteriota bacterium]
MPSSPRPAILAIDDDPDVLRAVARDLRRRYGSEYRVVRADSGDAALAVLDELEQRQEPVALLLSDQRMPGMDGVTFLRHARERAAFSGTKRVLLTAYADTSAAIDAINGSQVDYYLLKPWDPPVERLYPVLDDLLQDWRAGYRPPFTGVRVIDNRWSPNGHALRDFLARNHVPYRFLDVESEESADWVTNRSLPVVLLQDGRRLEAPELTTVAEALGLRTRAEQAFYDLAIIGGGPAGLASAVYGGSEGLRTVLVERQATGGQAGTSSRIENYLGFPSGLSGGDLARRATDQARRFGVELLTPQSVEKITVDGPYKHLALADGSTLSTHVVMLSMGVSWRTLAGTEPFAGRGIYYGAALTEAPACRDKTVYIVGAGNSAGQAAMYLADHAKQVVLLVRGGDLGAKMSSYLVDRIEADPRIRVRLHTTITAFDGDQQLERLTLHDAAAGTDEEVETQVVFVMIGAAPRTEWLRDTVALDDRGFVLTGPDLQPEHLDDWPNGRQPWLLETNVPGIFAAGDVRHDSVKRVASAVGEGSVAVHFMHRYLASR